MHYVVLDTGDIEEMRAFSMRLVVLGSPLKASETNRAIASTTIEDGYGDAAMKTVGIFTRISKVIASDVVVCEPSTLQPALSNSSGVRPEYIFPLLRSS